MPCSHNCGNCAQCNTYGYPLNWEMPSCNNPCSPSTPACPTPEEPNYTNDGCYPLIRTDCVVNSGGENECIGIEEDSTLTEIISSIITYVDNLHTRVTTSPGISFGPPEESEEDCHELELSIVLSPDEDNILEERENGLYVPNPPGGADIEITPVDTPSIVITATGTAAHTLEANLILDTISNGGDNIAEITDDGLYVPPPVIPDPFELTEEILCDSLSTLYTDSDDDEQKNTENPDNYYFLAINRGEGCLTKQITSPPGFAVVGPNRVSAFGKMEWYANLSDANTSAVAGETVMLYSDTSETLIPKNNVNYEGVGLRTIGGIIASNYTGTLSNLSTTVSDVSGDYTIFAGTSSVHLNNVFIRSTDCNIYISDSSQVWGGSWTITDNSKRLVVQNTAKFAKSISIKAIVNVTTGASFLFHELADTSAYLGSSGLGVINVGAGTPYVKPKVAFCTVTSTNNIGIASFYSCDVSHNSVTTEVRTAVYVHGGSDVGISAQPTFINVTNNYCFSKNQSGLTVVSSQVNGGYTLNSLIHWNVAYNTGTSELSPGITSIEGNLRHCVGYSFAGTCGIFVGGSDYPSSVTRVIECVGEAKAGAGLIATRNIFISGGHYISRLNSANGNGIQLADNSNYRQNGSIPDDEYFHIVNVTTEVRNASAYGIAHLNTSQPGSYPAVPIKVKVWNNVPLCATVETGALGIDPNANLIKVTTTIDAYGNHT